LSKGEGESREKGRQGEGEKGRRGDRETERRCNVINLRGKPFWKGVFPLENQCTRCLT